MFTVSIVRYEERTVVPVMRGHFHKTTNIEKHTLYTTAILKNKASGKGIRVFGREFHFAITRCESNEL